MLNEYQVIRYGVPDSFYIDVIAGLGDPFHYTDVQYITKEINGVTVRIAAIETLYEMEKDTVRLVDQTDAVFLHELLQKMNGN